MYAAIGLFFDRLINSFMKIHHIQKYFQPTMTKIHNLYVIPRFYSRTTTINGLKYKSLHQYFLFHEVV